MNRHHLNLLECSKYHRAIMLRSHRDFDSGLMVEVCEACEQPFPCDAIMLWRAYEEEQVKNQKLVTALAFYADWETYFGMGFFPDPPCGGFEEDFETIITDYGEYYKPGKLARETLEGM